MDHWPELGRSSPTSTLNPVLRPLPCGLTRVLNSPLSITSPAAPTVAHDVALLATPIGVASLGEPDGSPNAQCPALSLASASSLDIACPGTVLFL